MEHARTIFAKQSTNNHIVGLVHKKHIINEIQNKHVERTCRMFHEACKVNHSIGRTHSCRFSIFYKLPARLFHSQSNFVCCCQECGDLIPQHNDYAYYAYYAQYQVLCTKTLPYHEHIYTAVLYEVHNIVLNIIPTLYDDYRYIVSVHRMVM